MNKLKNIGQKISGSVQQIKGEIEDRSGQHLKGNMDKIGGKIKATTADIKMKVDNYHD